MIFDSKLYFILNFAKTNWTSIIMKIKDCYKFNSKIIIYYDFFDYLLLIKIKNIRARINHNISGNLVKDEHS